MLQTLKTNKRQWLFNTELNCHYNEKYEELPCLGNKCELCKLGGEVIFERDKEAGEKFLLEARKRVEDLKKIEEFRQARENAPKEVKREDRWRQDTPRMQVSVLLGAVLGDVNNLKEGIASDKAYERIEKFLGDVEKINQNYMNESW